MKYSADIEEKKSIEKLTFYMEKLKTSKGKGQILLLIVYLIYY